MNLTNNLTLEQATFSNYAKTHNLLNNPSEQEIEAIKYLSNNVYEKLLSEGWKLKINSFYRSKELNKLIGGSATSQHCKGQALDIMTTNGQNKELFNHLKDNYTYDQLIWEKGTKYYPSWVHISLKPYGNRKQVLYLK